MWCCNEWQRNLSITGPNSIWPQQFEEHLIMFLSIDPFNSHFRKPISFSSLAFPFHQRNIFLKLNMWTRNNVLKADLDLSNAIISRLWCNNEFSCQIYNQCFSGKTPTANHIHRHTWLDRTHENVLSFARHLFI